jgi:hypothetical protein
MRPFAHYFVPRTSIRHKTYLENKIKSLRARLYKKHITKRTETKTRNEILYLRSKLQNFVVGKFQIKIHKKDIVLAPHNRVVCHCVARDFYMSRGAAGALKNNFPFINSTRKHRIVGRCVTTTSNGRTFINLITKENSGGKPTIRNFKKALLHLRQIIINKRITSISATQLGCGLDRLSWDRCVLPLLLSTFKDLPLIMNIYVL